MRLVRWSFHNLHIPLMEADDGTLYCTTQVLTAALGINRTSLHKLHERHKAEFSGLMLTDSQHKTEELPGLNVTDSKAKAFLQEHRSEFGLRRLRADTRLWSEDDMILIACLSRSPGGLEFRRGVVQLIKSNARRGTVSMEQYEADLANLQGQLQELKDMFLQSEAARQTAASAAGTALQAQRKDRHLHLVE